MYTIHVHVTIDAPLEQVFEAIADHEHFLSGPNMSCRLTNEGAEHRGGVGAVREVTADGSAFTEEITAYDPPRHYEYMVRSLTNAKGKSVPLRHERGWLDFREAGNGTQVDWYSRFAVTTPIVGWFVERLLGPRAASGFRKLLEQTKANLETASTAVRSG